MLAEANEVLTAAMSRMQPGTFQLRALIAAHRTNAATADDTDWAAVALLYGKLPAMTASPVVALNHAVAVVMPDGPDVGRAQLRVLRLSPTLSGAPGSSPLRQIDCVLRNQPHGRRLCTSRRASRRRVCHLSPCKLKASPIAI